MRSSRGAHGECVLSHEYEGLTSGDPVRVDASLVGDRVWWAGSFTFEFMQFVTNIATGHQWVEMYGGDPKWAHVFACDPEAIIKVDAK